MNHGVFVLRDKSIAELLNTGLDDDSKVAFQNETGDEFYARLDADLSAIDESDYLRSEITQSVVDGSLPVTKTRRIYP